jgi:hypothetical protein
MKFATECINSMINVHEIPALDTANEAGRWHYIDQQVAKAQDEITFKLESTDYIDLSSVQLYCLANVYPNLTESSSNTKDTLLSTNAPIGIVNNFLHSLWKTVSVTIGDLEIDNSSSLYSFKEYILKILNSSPHEEHSVLGSAVFFKDDAGEFNNFKLVTETAKVQKVKGEQGDQAVEITTKEFVNTNSGFLKRRNLLISGNGKIEMMGHLQCDIFNVSKLLLPNTTLNIKLFRNEDKFCILGDDASKYSINIMDIKLRVRTQKLSAQVQNAHNALLLKNPAIYHMKSSLVKKFSVGTAGSNFKLEISKGKVPNVVIVALSNYGQLNSANKNPFNFQHFGVKEIEFRVGEYQIPYAYILKMNYANNQYLNAYTSLFDVVSKPDLGNNITRQDYPNGYALYGFNLQSSINCVGDFAALAKEGPVTIEVTFATKPTEDDLDLYCYLEYDKFLEINSSREATLS